MSPSHCPQCGRFMAHAGTWNLDRGARALGFTYVTIRMSAWACWSCRRVELAARKELDAPPDPV